MRAGLLAKDTIHILEMRKTTSETGAQRKEYAEVCKIKAYRKKLSAAVGDGVNASEEFISNTIVFQVRKCFFLNEKIRIKYGDNTFEVILLDKQRDNTFLMTCRKVNT